MLNWLDPPMLMNSVSHPQDGVPVDVAISPDGTKVAYTFYGYECDQHPHVNSGGYGSHISIQDLNTEPCNWLTDQEVRRGGHPRRRRDRHPQPHVAPH